MNFPTRQDVWIADPDGNILYEDDALGPLFTISGIGSSGELCGSHFVATTGAVAVAGTIDGGLQPLFDGGSDCVAISPSGNALVFLGARTLLRQSDGGTIFINDFAYRDGGINLTHGFAVSDSASVVGYVSDGAPFGRGNPAAFFWVQDGGTILDNGPRESEAYGFGPNGEIVGSGVDTEGNKVAVRWATPASAPEVLPLPSGYVSATALAVNGAGVVVGWGLDSASASHGLVWWHDRVYLADDVVGPPAIHIFWLGLANAAGRVVGFTSEPGMLADGGAYSNARTFAFDFISYPP